MKRLTALLVIAGATSWGADANAQATIGPGAGELSATLPTATLKVFTYRPASCTPRRLLFVFHGVGRDAGPYRDRAQPLADRTCTIAIAPEFDSERFPASQYQRGGSTVALVTSLVTWARTAAGQSDMPYILIGHSAGAQFLSRVAAYGTTAATRIVISNPSTWVLPSTSAALPYGFGGVANAEQAMRTYLALPIVLLLGGADTDMRNLSTTKEAMAQGPDRLSRGRNTFQIAKSVTHKEGWSLGWTLVEVPGVGHDAARMFSSPQTAAAIGQ